MKFVYSSIHIIKKIIQNGFIVTVRTIWSIISNFIVFRSLFNYIIRNAYWSKRTSRYLSRIWIIIKFLSARRKFYTNILTLADMYMYKHTCIYYLIFNILVRLLLCYLLYLIRKGVTAPPVRTCVIVSRTIFGHCETRVCRSERTVKHETIEAWLKLKFHESLLNYYIYNSSY